MRIEVVEHAIAHTDIDIDTDADTEGEPGARLVSLLNGEYPSLDRTFVRAKNMEDVEGGGAAESTSGLCRMSVLDSIYALEVY